MSALTKPRVGRPPIDLPGGITPETHEATRRALGISMRAYARRLGIPFGTYYKKTRDVDPSPAAQRRAEAKAARLRQAHARERERSLRAALTEAEADVTAAQARVRAIRRQLRGAQP